eukprot:5633349-Alexandrium_andersonii.AAC.1
MSASLVGSEMCIRDRSGGGSPLGEAPARPKGQTALTAARNPQKFGAPLSSGCLLYTSDAADDMQ